MNLQRASKLKALLIDKKYEAALIASPANLLYFANFNCLSPMEREAFIFVTKEQIFLITSKLYLGDSSSFSKDITVVEASKGLSFLQTIIKKSKDKNIKKIGIEENFLNVSEYKELLSEKLELSPLNLRNIRVNKDPSEIELIEKACDIGDETFEYLLTIIKLGITEIEIAKKLEIFVLNKNATLSFPSIIAFNKNAAVPHHATGYAKLKNESCVLLDFGVKVDGYCSDMSRTIFVGKPEMDLEKAYYATLNAQEKAIDYIKNNINKENSALFCDKIAREHIKSQGFPDYPHTLGHGIGLQVHEAPSLYIYSNDRLNNGYVFSVEPGIYIDNKFGIRIEDLVVIENNTVRNLTKARKDLIIL